jgi:calcium channel MID1
MGQPFLNGSFLDNATITYANTSMAINGSRNPLIDQNVVPGPYKEVLPCDDLCFNLMRSCPASMQFQCPMPGAIGFNSSYGTKPLKGGDQNGRITNITCNYPGVAYYLAAGGRTVPSLMFVIVMAVMGFVLLV